MIRQRLFTALLITSLLGFLVKEAFGKGLVDPNPKGSIGITAQAVQVVDDSNGKVLFSQNAHLKSYPASTVKLLTALVVLERKDLNAQVFITRDAANATPTKAGLTQGAYYTVEDLLRVLLATSANDAAVALAQAVAGSEEKFALLMNEKAKALGADESYFTNATGLPDKRQMTTAYDLSVISRSAFRQPFFASVMKQKIVTIQGSDGRLISRENHNKLLWKLREPCVLGKTGYTRAARHCYAGIAYYDDDRHVSIVIIKSRKPWVDICRLLNMVSYFSLKRP